MKQYLDTAPVQLSFSEVDTLTSHLVIAIDKFIKEDAPKVVVRRYTCLARKLNDVLRVNGLNYYTDEKFQEFETYIANHK